MAYNKAPSAWLENWSEDATNITVPIATFPELTAAEADGTTGDIRKVMYAILRKLVNEWHDTAVADRPTQMDVKDTYNTDSSGNLVQRIQVEFKTSGVVGAEVVDEPA